MKKLLFGSVALLVFAIAITLFQISCQKEARGQQTTYTLPPATTSTLGGVIVGQGLQVDASGRLTGQLNKIIYVKSTITSAEIWTANYDGTNQTKVNISLPAGLFITGEGGNGSLAPDGQTVFFNVQETSNSKWHIYSCNIDGSNLRRVVDAGSFDTAIIGSAN